VIAKCSANSGHSVGKTACVQCAHIGANTKCYNKNLQLDEGIPAALLCTDVFVENKGAGICREVGLERRNGIEKACFLRLPAFSSHHRGFLWFPLLKPLRLNVPLSFFIHIK